MITFIVSTRIWVITMISEEHSRITRIRVDEKGKIYYDELPAVG